MANAELSNRFEIGVVGLDSSGRRLARAIAGQRLSIVACECDAENIKALQEEAQATSIPIAAGIKQFMGLLRQSRTVVVSESGVAGESFSDLLGQLEAGDLLIDAGNCYFKDCGRRARCLAERNIRYLGMAIIGGGEEGDCSSVLAIGGRAETCQSVLPLLKLIAAKRDDQPCVSHLGPAAAAHFVKMIHNGVEHSLMQLVFETFDLLQRILLLADDKLHDLANVWQKGAFHSYLVEFTGSVQNEAEQKTRKRQLEKRLQAARRDDSVRWASLVARELEAPIPTLDAAAGTRNLSEWEKQHDFATTAFRQPLGHFGDDTESVLKEMHEALRAAILITYAQGMALLAAGSDQYGFNIDKTEVLRLWKGCCGIRTALLHEMTSALQATPHLPSLLHDEDLSEKVMQQQECLRHAVWRAGPLQTSVPALMASLDYLDFHRGVWLPINLMQVPATRIPHAVSPRPFPVPDDTSLHFDWNYH